MTHIDNIPHILSVGFVHANSPKASKTYIQIGDPNVIGTRKTKVIDDGHQLGDYIPFYFGTRSPMLYEIQNGYHCQKYAPELIVYCVVLLKTLEESKLSFVFTDGHALSVLSHIYQRDKIGEVNRIISYSDVYAHYWVNDLDSDLKRRKEAELLLLDELPPEMIRFFVVYNETAKDKLVRLGINPEDVFVKPGFYF